MNKKPEITPLARIANGYRATEADVAAKRRTRAASTFRHSDRMERLLAIKARDPAAYAKFDVTQRIALGHYELAKTAAHQEDDHGDHAA